MGGIYSTKNLAFADAMDDHGRRCLFVLLISIGYVFLNSPDISAFDKVALFYHGANENPARFPKKQGEQ